VSRRLPLSRRKSPQQGQSRPSPRVTELSTKEKEPALSTKAKTSSGLSQVVDDPLGAFFRAGAAETPADPLEEAVEAAVASLAETSKRGGPTVDETEVCSPKASAAATDVPPEASAAGHERCGTDDTVTAVSVRTAAAPSGEVAAAECAKVASPHAVKEEETAAAAAVAMSLLDGSAAEGAKKEQAAPDVTPFPTAESSATGAADATSVVSVTALVPASDCSALPLQALGASSVAGGSMGMGSIPAPDVQILDVALIFRGKRKLVRHSSNTRVGEILDQHPSLARIAKKPLVLVDRDGFEIGRELELWWLLGGSSASDANISSQTSTPLLELEVRPDEWAP